MFARPYLYVTVIVLALGILYRQGALVGVGVLAGLTLLIAWGWQRAALAGVTYERRFAEDHVFWGETVALDVAITNFKLLPLSWLETEEPFPRQLEFVEGAPALISVPRHALLAHTTALRWFERVRWRYTVRCPARGLYRFGPVTLRSGDLFGLFSRAAEQAAPARLYVYPKLLDLTALGLPPRHPFGDIRAQQPLLEDPLRTAGVREYRPEDPFKRVHWKATARTGQLQVRQYEQTTEHTLMLFLNVESYAHIYEGIDSARAEWAIVVAASLARYATTRRWSVGLRSNAPAADEGDSVRIAPGRSPGQLTRMLEGLARMLIYPVQGFTEVLRAEAQSLPAGATVVVITPVLPDPLRGALLRLRERGLRLVICALTDARPEPIPGALLYHLPPPAGAGFLRLPEWLDPHAPLAPDAPDVVIAPAPSRAVARA
jgi:uncharacterized protein (DUF58 family)